MIGRGSGRDQHYRQTASRKAFQTSLMQGFWFAADEDVFDTFI
jgi:hypothetical protein